MMKSLFACLILTICGMLGYVQPSICATPISMNLDSNQVTIGALFSGARVSVSGMTPAGSEVAVLVTGPPEDMTLKTKGRALGLLWMNLGSVTFHQVPTLYLLHTSKVVGDFARSNPDKWRELGIGLDSLKGRIESMTDAAGTDTLCQQFLKMKQDEGLYGACDGAVRYASTENQKRSFATDVSLPSRISPGQYGVKVLALKDGSIVGTATKHIEVREVGVPALLSSLAFNHGSLYGLLAVLVAVGAGLLMDFLFGGRKGSH